MKTSSGKSAGGDYEQYLEGALNKLQKKGSTEYSSFCEYLAKLAQRTKVSLRGEAHYLPLFDPAQYLTFEAWLELQEQAA